MEIDHNPVTLQDKRDVIRAEFALEGWKRQPDGSMKKGDCMAVFKNNNIKLKKLVGGEYVDIRSSSVDLTYINITSK